MKIKRILSESVGLEGWIEIGGKVRFDGKICKVNVIEKDGEKFNVYMTDSGTTTYDALGLNRPIFAVNSIPVQTSKLYKLAVFDVIDVEREEVAVEEKVVINGQEFASFVEALEAIKDGDVVEVSGDVVFEEKVTLDKQVTINLSSDSSLVIPTVENNYGMVVKGDVTINGDGYAKTGDFGIGVPPVGKLTINGGEYKTEGTYLIGSWGEVVINGGTFESPYCCANAFNGGKVFINGGNFVCPDGNTMILGEDANSVMRVSGGTFNHPVKEKYCAEGYVPKDNGDGTYTVELSA